MASRWSGRSACGPEAGVVSALRGLGYTVVEIDVQRDVAERLRAERVEVALVALHGRYGEDGCIQGLLESMFIPYTGSGLLASSVGMDKVFSSRSSSPTASPPRPIAPSTAWTRRWPAATRCPFPSRWW